MHVDMQQGPMHLGGSSPNGMVFLLGQLGADQIHFTNDELNSKSGCLAGYWWWALATMQAACNIVAATAGYIMS